MPAVQAHFAKASVNTGLSYYNQSDDSSLTFHPSAISFDLAPWMTRSDLFSSQLMPPSNKM